MRGKQWGRVIFRKIYYILNKVEILPFFQYTIYDEYIYIFLYFKKNHKI